MPVLTALAPDPARPSYRVVEVDRGRFASLPESALAPLRLVVGAPLPPAALDRLHELADVEAALRAGVRMLALRAHARAGLRRKLLGRQHPPAAVDAALAVLAERGLLDDRGFAERFAVTQARRGRGPARLLRDLQVHGVARAVAEAAVPAALAAEGVDLREEARRVARRRLAAVRGFDLAERVRRLAGYLVRRGYSTPDALAVAREVCPNS